MAAGFDALLSYPLTVCPRYSPSVIMAPAFTLFSDLPFELRQLIWQLALPDDVPEVLILQPENLGLLGRDTIPEPMTVDTAFPALMHACRESRDFVLKHGGLRFRSSRKARCEVPFRPFRSDLDTAFWNQDLLPYLWDTFCSASLNLWLSQLQHLAIASSRAFRGKHVTDCIARHCPELRCLSLVFSDSSNNNWAMSRFVEPKRRHKLRCIHPDRARAMTVWSDAVWCDPEYQITLENFLMLFCEEVNAHGESTSRPHEDCLGWTWSIDSCAKRRCFAQTFVEWCGGEWVEGFTKWMPPRG